MTYQIKTNTMKVAKLVYSTIMTRVIVDINDSDSTITELAVPKLCANLMDSPHENIEKIVEDTECPYIIGEEYNLSIGDSVDMPEPSELLNDAWQHEFTGSILNIFEYKETIYVTVEDMDENCFDIEAERLIN